MMTEPLTEAEFRLFAEQLGAFARQLRPRERSFLIDILLRATTARPFDRQSMTEHPDSFMAVSLACALWQSSGIPDEPLSVNPQPLPSEGVTPDGR